MTQTENRVIPYGRQNINKKDIQAVVAAINSGWLTQGPHIGEFEKVLTQYTGARFAVAVSHGTAALHLAYRAAGLGAGDEVIVPANTFVATSNMLLAVGARPVFCDIRPDTCNLDEAKIEKLITRKTRAIVPVHFAGQPCDMAKIAKIARKHKLLVVEDACHALGASYGKKKIGSLSDMSVMSFHPVKSITTGEGGAILTNNPKFYSKLVHLRSHGVTKDKIGFNVMTDLGYNYRLTDIQAALGTSQMQRLNDFIKKRHAVIRWYAKHLAGNKNIIIPKNVKGSRSSWHIYVIRVKNPRDRMPLYNLLKAKGVGINFHYPPVYSHPYYRRHGYRSVHLPVADLYAATAITLPLHTLLTQKDIKYITSVINEYYQTHTR